MTDLPFPLPSAPQAPDAGVRRARATDAADIAAVQVAAWRQQYADVLPASSLGAEAEDQMAQHWAESIEHPPTQQHAVHVATAGRLLVGYAVTAPVDDEPGVGEVSDLQVHPDATRLGHGSRLLAAVVESLIAHGVTTMVTWCGETDTTRRAFLESAGLAADGVRRRLDMGEGTAGVDEVRFGARLD